MNNRSAALMIQGTTSDAGKSITVAGLCRVLKRRGYSVAPFKPQNMALNSAVTASGGEIGRAQALQAFACDLQPHIDFNPVLLKPSGDQRSQVILHGKAVSHLEARSFGSIKQLAFQSVLESYQRLQQQYDFVIIEGAGSPAEINLRKNDIANMGFAEAVNCPVALIGDIDRGVFAHLIGTLQLLSPSEQNRVIGFIINKFRGNLDLLQGGLDWLTDYSQKPLFGVLPYLHDLRLDAEDAIRIDPNSKGDIVIKVPVLSRISNHTDFDPLAAHPDVRLEFVRSGDSLDGADLIILPGSKNVRAEMQHLIDNGWDQQIKRHCRYGGKLLGICGGYQLLGNRIDDPQGIEDTAGSVTALGLIEMRTELLPNKQLKQVSGQFAIGDLQGALSGYEIHCGQSHGAALQSAFAQITDQQGNCYNDGVVSDDQQIIGTYLHGLFEHAECLNQLIHWISGKASSHKIHHWDHTRREQLDRLADCFEQHLNIDQMIERAAAGITNH